MDKVYLLEEMKAFSEGVTKGLLLKVMPQKNNPHPENRAPQVYTMRLPDSNRADAKAPYILHQFITGKDQERDGELMDSSAVVRSIIVTYDEDEQAGAMALLTVMERLRIALLKQVVIGDQFELDVHAGIESIVYPEDTAPHYRGEMVTTWRLPTIQREVPELWQ